MRGSLRAVGLEKSFGNRKAVDGVSIEVHEGEVVGLLGPNGAGKTTVFSLILGLVPGDGGRVYLRGEDITEYPMYMRARKGVCLLPQEPSAFRKLSVEDNLRAVVEARRGTGMTGGGDIAGTLAAFGLEKLARARAVDLSGGERRRLEIARAMITNPDFLLLDEPFTGVDPLGVGDLQRTICALRERGVGVLVTDHSVRETLRTTDRAVILDRGRILAEGTPEEILASEAARKSYLGDEFRL
jgi:lipopolysaccharide export system ATP-binding protein